MEAIEQNLYTYKSAFYPWLVFMVIFCLFTEFSSEVIIVKIVTD